ncbi:hypothetical protein ACOMHN_003384 [Nucella lapillus]
MRDIVCPCVRGVRPGGRAPCVDDGDRRSDPGHVWPEEDFTDSGDFDPIPVGAQLYMGSYVSPYRTPPPSRIADRLWMGRPSAATLPMEGYYGGADGEPGDDFLLAESSESWAEIDGEMEGEAERKGERERLVPVVVVEEHHEVIPYWFGAVDQGLMPPQGNVLLHIDAHADVTVPRVNASFPLFRPPQLADLMYLMQRNDMFITGAALTGLFSRYIWIIPPWDTRLADVMGPTGFKRYRVFAGLLQDPDYPQEEKHTEGSEQSQDPEVCYCVDFENQESGHDAGMSSRCFFKVQPSQQGVTDSVISREMCKPRVHAVVEMVREDKAIELLKNLRPGKAMGIGDPNLQSLTAYEKPWLEKRDSVVLDIDEDYFGVEAAFTPLQEASVNMRVVDIVSQAVSRLFCAQDAQQEARTDAVFTDLVHSIHADLLACQQHPCAARSHSAVEHFSRRLEKELVENSVYQFLCVERRSDWNGLVAYLIGKLFHLGSRQLLALSQVGICLKESPMTMGFDPSRGMKVCTGYNRPDNSVVTFHVPDRAEVEERSRQLRLLLGSGRFTPRVVTLARSVRDGYTPRGLFQKIEGEVLNTLRLVYPRVDPKASVIYDSQLWRGFQLLRKTQEASGDPDRRAVETGNARRPKGDQSVKQCHQGTTGNENFQTGSTEWSRDDEGKEGER